MRTIDSLGFYNIDRLTKDIIKKDSIFLFAIDIKDFFKHISSEDLENAIKIYKDYKDKKAQEKENK